MIMVRFRSLSGRNCEEIVYDCSSHACQAGGVCVPTGPTTYTCQCKPYYFGEFCQIHIGQHRTIHRNIVGHRINMAILSD